MGNKPSQVVTGNKVPNKDRRSDVPSSSSGQDPMAAGGPPRHESSVATAGDITPLPRQREVRPLIQGLLPPIPGHLHRPMSTQEPPHSYSFRHELNPRQLSESYSSERNRYSNEPSLQRQTSSEYNSQSRYLRQMKTVGDFNEVNQYQEAKPGRSDPEYPRRPNISTSFDNKYQDRESARSRLVDDDRCRQMTPTRFDDEYQRRYGTGNRFTENNQLRPKTSSHFDEDYPAREEPQNRYFKPQPENLRYVEYKARPATAATGQRSAWEEREDSPLEEQTIHQVDNLYSQLMQNLQEMHNAYTMHAAQKQTELLVCGEAFDYCNLKIVVCKGKIEDEDTDAIVNSTSSDFNMLGAISKAIGKRAGAEWIERCRKIRWLDDVRVTDAGKLDCHHVIHVRAPNNIDDCRRLVIKALLNAASLNIKSISFPMIGTGGQQLDCGDVARALSEVLTVAAQKKQLKNITKVRFVAYDYNNFEIFLSALKKIIEMASAEPEQPSEDSWSSSYPDSVSVYELPSNWTTMNKYVLSLQVELMQSDREFEYVKALFEREKSKPVKTAHFQENCTLEKVIRLQNPILFKHYKIEKEKFMKKYNKMPSGWRENKMERTLFHGTSEDTVFKINSEGFDRSFCGKHMTLYGQGVYFACDLSYSCKPTYSPPNSNNIKFIYVVKALVGTHTQGEEEMLHLPVNIECDSAVDNIYDPTIFVLFRDYQVYPKYIMHIKDVERA